MAAFKKISLLLLSLLATLCLSSPPPLGTWTLLQPSVGICAMHMQLLRNNHVVILDRTDFGYSNLSLPRGICRLNDEVLPLDCSAHSALYSVGSNTFRPLTVQTNVFCSSGAVNPNGTLIQTGGYLAGDKKIRLFSPEDLDWFFMGETNILCSSGDVDPNGTLIQTEGYLAGDKKIHFFSPEDLDWSELRQTLAVRRWYATNQILPDGRVIIVGGRKQFSYEFFPSTSPSVFRLPFLKSTTDSFFEENNLYPFVHLLPNGDLFIFANRRSIQFNYKNNRVVREFPEIPGAKRNYPSSGSSVLLPLYGEKPDPEVMVCGGAPEGAFYKANNLSVYVAASNTCGRLRVWDNDPIWVMENMPMNRVMSDMILLPTGDVLIINGASNGTAGWEDATGPVLNPVLYSPTEKRFIVLNPTVIPRMYHSAAILLPDGRILVGGSNPHKDYNFTADKYPTELSLEAFYPPYLAPVYTDLRPSILTVETGRDVISYGQNFSLTFVGPFNVFDGDVIVSLIAPPFTTHAFGMNQRLIFLDVIDGIQRLSLFVYKVSLRAPSSANIAPPGYYMLFLVHVGVPGECVWVKVDN